jgi:arginine/lysine/ornithine decarboxylase
MPGENAGALDRPLLSYLAALEDYDRRFPGFEHDIHGVERDRDGDYLIECLTDRAAGSPASTGLWAPSRRPVGTS